MTFDYNGAVKFAIAVGVILTTFAVAHAKAPEDPTIAEAKRHYEAGLAHFNLREYKAAVDEFEAAYRLRPDPVFLFNLGQAYRLGDDPDQALHFYRAYLRMKPNAYNRREVEERIAALEQVIADKQKLQRPPDHTLPPEPPPGPTPPAPAPPTPAPQQLQQPPAPPPPVDERAGRSKRIAGLATAAAGVAAIGVAVGFSVLAKQASDKLTHGTPGSTYDFALDRQGRTDQNVAIALYCVGGAAVAAGAVVWALGYRESGRRRFVLAPMITPNQAGALARVRF